MTGIRVHEREHQKEKSFARDTHFSCFPYFFNRQPTIFGYSNCEPKNNYFLSSLSSLALVSGQRWIAISLFPSSSCEYAIVISMPFCLLPHQRTKHHAASSFSLRYIEKCVYASEILRKDVQVETKMMDLEELLAAAWWWWCYVNL